MSSTLTENIENDVGRDRSADVVVGHANVNAFHAVVDSFQNQNGAEFDESTAGKIIVMLKRKNVKNYAKT